MYWECMYWDPDGFDPWISLVHFLILDSILGVSLVYSLIMMGTTLGISWISLVHSLILCSIFGLSLIYVYYTCYFFDFCSFLDPYDFDPWISLVHSLVLMGTTLGISLVTLGISWISLILGLILGISLVHGYDPWDFLVL